MSVKPFFDQTGQFPTCSQQGNKYVMVMVEIDSYAILLEPLTSWNDGEMIRAYGALVKCLQHTGVSPKNMWLTTKSLTTWRNTSGTSTTLPLNLYHQDATDAIPRKWQFTTSKHIFWASLPGSPNLSHPINGTASSCKRKSLLTYCNNPMPPLPFWHMHTCADHSTTTKCHWHQWVAKYKCTRKQTSTEYGHSTVWMDSIFTHPPKIIELTTVT